MSLPTLEQFYEAMNKHLVIIDDELLDYADFLRQGYRGMVPVIEYKTSSAYYDEYIVEILAWNRDNDSYSVKNNHGAIIMITFYKACSISD